MVSPKRESIVTFITDFGSANPGDTVSIQLFPAARHEGIVGRDGYIISRSRRFGGVVSLAPSVFSDGRLRDNHGYIGRLGPEETVCRAEELIGERGYDVMSHNCVHFVNWVNGLHRDSRMSDNFLQRPSLSEVAKNFLWPRW